MKKNGISRLVTLLIGLGLLFAAISPLAYAQTPTPVDPALETGLNNRVWLPLVANTSAADEQRASLDPGQEIVADSQISTTQTSVIVILKDQLNVKTIGGSNRKIRRKNLVQALRKKSDAQMIRQNLRADAN